ncbi:hypothetical protein T02_771 [Trichinella nativa]|uniref:Secreted protein n=1 Tax=Trichinella nativa TaxID=6335 RepID=A0A0V1L9R3_9BILA|nr:hypothetical protein T02_771 [Trichinella nativa]
MITCRTLALSMTLFCHWRCHHTITDTTCNGNEMRLDQPQKGRSSDKCETVNALRICCYVEIKSNQDRQIKDLHLLIL